ncbi:MAG TPA: PH domain-containing protein [Thermoanaerobaculia bacterium]|nr:PH domain-containing protein [Thermoanaerobaculia bacterium]
MSEPTKDSMPQPPQSTAADGRAAGAAPVEHAEVQALERPHPNLLKYYALGSLMLGPFLPFALLPLYFKYHTLRYRFDEQGVSMRWGILFRREISLNYSRIQDIHLASNIVERWLGLGRVQVQTASGASAAEMTIEGLQEYEAVRDYLYSRMRGARRLGRSQPSSAPRASSSSDEALAVALREVAAELAAVRRALEERSGASPSTSSAASSATSSATSSGPAASLASPSESSGEPGE